MAMVLCAAPVWRGIPMGKIQVQARPPAWKESTTAACGWSGNPATQRAETTVSNSCETQFVIQKIIFGYALFGRINRICLRMAALFSFYFH